MGKVLYQALPLLRFFVYKIRACEKVRKGDGEPGDEASSALLVGVLWIPLLPPKCHKLSDLEEIKYWLNGPCCLGTTAHPQYILHSVLITQLLYSIIFQG